MTATVSPTVTVPFEGPAVAVGVMAGVDAHDPDRSARRAWRLRLLACCTALVVLAFVQRPGRLVPDTKLDLTADPLGLLARALHLWEPGGFFGQLQNQAYGYLFPMGPAFGLADVVGVPGWVAQRLWWSLVLVVAFLGVVRLCGALGIGTPSTRVVAGFAFALAPRMVTVLGAASVEAWPMALAPWALLPLVRARDGRNPLRAAALGAVVVVCAGGVNAVATGAVLVLPTLWLLLEPDLPHRRRLAAWWVGLTALATAWWWIPLLLLGGYSPPFLDWIETASVTTGPTSLVEAVRGTSHWLAYLGGPFGPEWPAGWLLVSRPALIVDTALVAGLGVVGLARRDLPHRRVLVAGLLLGLTLVTAGHVGPHVSGIAAGWVQDALDGPLAPARNVHKFDLVLRLPLVIGLAHVLARATLPRVARPVAQRALLGIAVLGLLGSAAPLVAGQVAPSGSYRGIPDYWVDTADWLEQHDDGGRALLVPGSSFGDYAWGRPRDEPLQALDSARWGVRDAVPLSSAGNIRLLDAVEERLAAGQGSTGLRLALQRAGVGYLVVRNDLDRLRADAPRPVLVHQALDRMPGVQRVATFGPAVGNALETPTVTQDSRLDLPYAAVEVFRVGPTELVSARALTSSLRVDGAAEALLDLGDAAVLGDRRAVFMAGDARSVEDPRPVPVVTDTLRRREAWFGAAGAEPGAVLRADEAPEVDRPARDYLPVDDPTRETVARVTGVRDATASSSGADPDALFARGPEHAPWAALDGDLGTSWLSGEFGSAVGEWLEVTLERPTDPAGLRVALHDAPPVATPVRSVVVTTDAGTVESTVLPGGEPQPVAVPSGATTRVRVTVATRAAGPATGVGIRELEIPGVAVERGLVVPTQRADDAAGRVRDPQLVLGVADGARPSCVVVGGRPLCAPTLARSGEEDAVLDRTVTLLDDATYEVVGAVRARPGPALDSMLALPDGRMTVTATSSAVTDPFARPQVVADRDLGTGWVADVDDEAPRLEVSWDEPRPVRGVQLLVDAALAASRPSRVVLTLGGERFVLDVDDEGYARLPQEVTVRSMTLEVLATTTAVDVDRATGVSLRMPAGLSELVVLGADDRRLPDDNRSRRVDLPCGWGPRLTVDGVVVPTAVSATAGQLLAGEPVPLEACDGPLQLSAGTHEVRLEASVQTRPVSLTMTPGVGVPEPGAVPRLDVTTWSATRRTVEVAAREDQVLLQVPENFNEGWTAALDGRRLDTVRADGWSQGVVVPAGPAGTVELVFAPDRPFRWALLLGGLAAVGVAVLALRPFGRGRRSAPSAPSAPAADPAGPPARGGASSRLRQVALAVLGAAALVLLGGSAGAAASGVCVTVALVVALLPAAGRWVPWGAGAAVLAAGVLVASAPWPRERPGALAAAPQLLVLVGVGMVVVVGPVSAVLRRRRPQAITGASR